HAARPFGALGASVKLIGVAENAAAFGQRFDERERAGRALIKQLVLRHHVDGKRRRFRRAANVRTRDNDGFFFARPSGGGRIGLSRRGLLRLRRPYPDHRRRRGQKRGPEYPIRPFPHVFLPWRHPLMFLDTGYSKTMSEDDETSSG